MTLTVKTFFSSGKACFGHDHVVAELRGNANEISVGESQSRVVHLSKLMFDASMFIDTKKTEDMQKDNLYIATLQHAHDGHFSVPQSTSCHASVA